MIPQRLRKLTYNRLCVMAIIDQNGRDKPLPASEVSRQMGWVARPCRELRDLVAMGWVARCAVGNGQGRTFKYWITDAGNAARAEYVRELFGAMPSHWRAAP